MNKYVLEIEPEFNFELIGIISPVRDYTIAWHINRAAGIDLNKNDDLQFVFVKDCVFYISNYIFEANYSLVRLLKNRPVEFVNLKKPYLLPELSKYDYFMMLEGAYAESHATLEQTLKNIPVINLAQRLEFQHLRSAENLIFN